MSSYDFGDYLIPLDARLDAMLSASNPDDIPFLVAAVRHFRDKVKTAAVDERRACAEAMCYGCRRRCEYDAKSGCHLLPESDTEFRRWNYTYCTSTPIRYRGDGII